MPLDEKRKYADFVIDTSGEKEDTLRQTRAVYDALRRIEVMKVLRPFLWAAMLVAGFLYVTRWHIGMSGARSSPYATRDASGRSRHRPQRRSVPPTSRTISTFTDRERSDGKYHFDRVQRELLPRRYPGKGTGSGFHYQPRRTRF